MGDGNRLDRDETGLDTCRIEGVGLVDVALRYRVGRGRCCTGQVEGEGESGEDGEEGGYCNVPIGNYEWTSSHHVAAAAAVGWLG